MALQDKLVGIGLFAGFVVVAALLVNLLAGLSPAEQRMVALGYVLGLMSCLLSLQAAWLVREWRRVRGVGGMAGDA